jgi:hypothetical protein
VAILFIKSLKIYHGTQNNRIWVSPRRL